MLLFKKNFALWKTGQISPKIRFVLSTLISSASLLHLRVSLTHNGILEYSSLTKQSPCKHHKKSSYLWQSDADLGTGSYDLVKELSSCYMFLSYCTFPLFAGNGLWQLWLVLTRHFSQRTASFRSNRLAWLTPYCSLAYERYWDRHGLQWDFQFPCTPGSPGPPRSNVSASFSLYFVRFRSQWGGKTSGDMYNSWSVAVECKFILISPT